MEKKWSDGQPVTPWQPRAPPNGPGTPTGPTGVLTGVACGPARLYPFKRCGRSGTVGWKGLVQKVTFSGSLPSPQLRVSRRPPGPSDGDKALKQLKKSSPWVSGLIPRRPDLGINPFGPRPGRPTIASSKPSHFRCSGRISLIKDAPGPQLVCY